MCNLLVLTITKYQTKANVIKKKKAYVVEHSTNFGKASSQMQTHAREEELTAGSKLEMKPRSPLGAAPSDC